MKIFQFDKTLNRIETDQDVLTLGALFVPFFIELILRNLLGTVNAITLGHYSDDSVAAVGTATQLINMLVTFYSVVCIGASVVISQFLGAGRREEAGRSAFATFLLTGALSAVAGVLFAVYARPVMAFMQLEGAVLDEATVYFRITAGLSIVPAMIAAFSAVFRSYGQPKPAVAVALIMNVINAVLNVIVVYRPFETPLHGVSGVAISLIISEMIALVLLVVLLRRSSIDVRCEWNMRRIVEVSKKMLTIGVPSGAANLSYAFAQVISTSIIAVFGVAALSAKTYVSNIFFYVFVIGLALGQATSIMVGRLVGAGQLDTAYRLSKQNLKLALFFNLVISAAIYAFGEPIMRVFTDDPTIISMAKTVMLIDILVEFGRAFNHVIINALNGAGDVVYQMVLSIASGWLISIGFSYLFGVWLGWGLSGCWVAFAMDEILRGLMIYRRWCTKKWTKKALLRAPNAG